MKTAKFEYSFLVFSIAAASLLNCSGSGKEGLRDKKKHERFDHSATHASELKFLKRRIDFGTVKQDTILSARFDFINTGTDSLIIDDILPDCSCTSHSLSSKVVAPSDSGYIVLNMSTKHKSGKVKVYSTVAANTPTHLYSLEILADVTEVH
jgi:hypothetical protein